MRKILISLLLAGVAATPAIAAGPRHDRDSAREERQQAREDRQSAREERQSQRQERGDRSDNNERPQVNRPSPPQVDVRQQANVRQQQMVDRREERADARADRGNNAAYVAPGARVVNPRVNSIRERQSQARDRRTEARELRQSTQPVSHMVRTRPPVVSTRPAPGTQPPLRADSRRGDHQRWDTNWRHNGRYDWHNYRNRHRSLFHLGFYFDPYGWGYQPFSIGWRLWPSYYSNRYWINDPWMYRLPYAPQGYVWVRYWNDALLVDTWTGTVVDVIPGFFW